MTAARWRDRFPKALILFSLLLAYCLVEGAFLSAASESDWVFPVGVASYLALLFLLPLAFRSLLRMKKQQNWRTRWLVVAAMLALGLPVAACFWAWRSVHPPGIRYDFSYGQSGSWGAVQFRFLENGVWREGPWVGGWHMEVRFPDLNGDGHADLQAIGRNRLAEYVYLPEGKDGCWWHLVQDKGFQVSYPPDGHSSP